MSFIQSSSTWCTIWNCSSSPLQKSAKSFWHESSAFVSGTLVVERPLSVHRRVECSRSIAPPVGPHSPMLASCQIEI